MCPFYTSERERQIVSLGHIVRCRYCAAMHGVRTSKSQLGESELAVVTVTSTEAANVLGIGKVKEFRAVILVFHEIQSQRFCRRNPLIPLVLLVGQRNLYVILNRLVENVIDEVVVRKLNVVLLKERRRPP